MKLLLVLALAVLASARPFSDEWERFKQTYGKTYQSDDEELRRNTIWQANKKYIEAHNTNADKFGFTLGMNTFGDLENHEFVANFGGYKQEMKHNSNHSFVYDPNTDMAASVDWREKGAVTEVKDQGQCGSCWAFTATGALEGMHFLKTGKLVSLSEQNLMDCSSPFGNHDCEGGTMDNSFTYVQKNHGIESEASYPYKAHKEECKFNPDFAVAFDSGYVDIARGDEKALTQAIQAVGPIAVAMDATRSTFQFYKSGVYYDSQCSSRVVGHSAVAVGYGSQDGKDYYIVKNSWGKKWGNEGYILMSRNKDNNCGIATEASYPKSN